MFSDSTFQLNRLGRVQRRVNPHLLGLKNYGGHAKFSNFEKFTANQVFIDYTVLNLEYCTDISFRCRAKIKSCSKKYYLVMFVCKLLNLKKRISIQY